MTIEQLRALAEDPKKFLSCCKCNEQRIKIKQAQIQHYRDLEYSITSELKAIPTFGNNTASKVENCSISILTIEKEIQAEILRLKENRQIIQDAINLINNADDSALKLLLEARYVNEMKWEEIAVLLTCSYRWTLRLHGQALKKIVKKAEEAILIHAVNAI